MTFEQKYELALAAFEKRVEEILMEESTRLVELGLSKQEIQSIMHAKINATHEVFGA